MNGRAALTSRSMTDRGGGDEAPQGTEGLRQRAHPDDRRTVRPRGAGEMRAPYRVGLVHDQSSVVPGAALERLCQIDGVAIHREHRIGDQHRPARPFGDQPGRLSEVEVGIDRHVGAGQPCAIDDRGVVELVGDDPGAGATEHAEHSEVGGEAGREHQRRLGALPAAKPGLELVVNRPCAADQPGRTRPRAPAPGGRHRRLDHRRVGAQTEIVVGGKRDDRGRRPNRGSRGGRARRRCASSATVQLRGSTRFAPPGDRPRRCGWGVPRVSGRRCSGVHPIPGRDQPLRHRVSRVPAGIGSPARR
jgi:hypothetical protein